MTIQYLDHVNIRPKDLDATVAFYRDVLGMEAGDMPSEGTGRGAWMKDGSGRACVHLLQDPEPAGPGSGAVNHVAFECQGHDDMCVRLDRLGVPYKKEFIASISLRQIFVSDPDEILVELNFRGN